MKYNFLIKPKTFFKIILVFVLFTGFQSCLKDKFNFDRMAQVEWEPTLAAPLLHTKLTLWDALNDWDSSHLFMQDQTHFLTLMYRGTVFSQTANQLITIPDQSFPAYDTTFNKPANTTTMEFIFHLDFNFQNGDQGKRLDEIYVKQGTWNFNLTTILSGRAGIVITIPSITKISNDSLLVTDTVHIPSGSQNTPNQVNLAGYKITFTHPTTTPTINRLNFNITVKFYDNIPSSGNSIILNSNTNNMLYSKLVGYFGQPAFDILKDTVFLDIFKRNLSGRFTIVDPQLNIYVSNSYGFPINIAFSQFASYRSVAPLSTVPISGSGLPNPWSIISPTLAQAGQTLVTPLSLNKNTSNIDDAINISPQFIVYNTSALGNPEGFDSINPNNPRNHNFVLDTSKFKVDVDVELPLYGKAIDFTVQDTFKMEEFKTENRDKIDWAAIRVITTNGFPVDVNLQLIFTDTLYHRIDSLYLNGDDNRIIASGILGAGPDYRVIMPYIKRSETMISGERINYMINHDVKKVLIKAVLNTANNHGTDVKFYSDYSIDIKIGVKTHLKIKY